MTQTPGAAFPGLTLAWRDHRGTGALSVSGWAEAELRELEGLDAGELNRRLALLTTEALESGGEPKAVPSVAGRFELAGGSVYFVPRFPFVAGMRYSLLAYRRPAGGSDDRPEVWNIQRPAVEAAPAANVVAIYPAVAEVPVNLLKIYVLFSEPMSEGRAQQAVRVCQDDTLQPLEGVFVPMAPELWDRQRQRLTLLLDPARIKRDLAPNLEAGYPLTEGVPFRLFIDPDFRDARGTPLRAGGDRRYQVGPAVRLRIDPGQWRLHLPAAGSLEPLAVEFERPLDHALLQRCLWVSGPEGTAVVGDAETDPGEKSWRFTPASPWSEGRHQLIVERELEDLAGNSPVRVFDRDITEPDADPPPAGRLAVDFTCVAAPMPTGVEPAE